MEIRQIELLTLVIENHIKTAEPVGSRFLVEQAKLDWSEATVRNDLRELEAGGYLTHPHTSAGRLPTTKGYRYYLEQLDLSEQKIAPRESATLEKAVSATSDYEQARKDLAKTLVALSEEMVLVAFSPDQVYYTGLATLFQKPDFSELNLVIDVSEVFDRCEDVLPDFLDAVSQEPRYFFGSEHPFGALLTVLPFRFGGTRESLFALIGPQRMDYRHNWGLMQKVKELI